MFSAKRIVAYNREQEEVAEKYGYEGAEDLKDAFVPGNGAKFNRMFDTNTGAIVLVSIHNDTNRII